VFAGVITMLAALTLVAAAAAVALGGALALPAGRDALRRAFGTGGRELLVAAWLVAAIAMVGSLYFSMRGLEPCRYCWFQRIAMYPLVLILGVAALRRDLEVWRYALPLSVLGGLLSIYHAALQLQPALEVSECTVGAPCTMRYFAVFGFVSIPWMAGAAFWLITALVSAAAVLRPE
jgi:disulfide bond formation protein DsbB